MRDGANGHKRSWTRTMLATLVVAATAGASLSVAAGHVASLVGPSSLPHGAIPALTALGVTLSPNPVAIDLGQSVVLTATATGGTTPYTGYTWYEGTFSNCAGDTQVATTTLPTYTLSGLVSNVYICVVVTDSEVPAATATSPSDLIVVNPALTIGAVGPTAALSPTGAIDNGQSVTLTASSSNGTAPLKFQWYSGPSPSSCTLSQILSATGPTLSVSPTTTTSYCFVVTDSSVGTPAQSGQSGPGTVTVDPTLVAGAPSPSGLYGDSGRSFNLTANPSGGTGTYTYAWFSGSSSTCSSDLTVLGTSRVQSVSPTASTYYCYSLSDSSYNPPTKQSPTDQVVVNATLTAGPITPASPAIDTGTAESVVLQANPTGGALTAPLGYTYQWFTGTFPACSADAKINGALGATYTAAPASSQYYCYEVTDANSTHAFSATNPLTVNPALVGGAVSPVAPQIDAGQSVILNANPSGGTPPYAYQWFAATSCAGTGMIPTATGATYTATASGSYIYRVTDSSVGLLAIGQRSQCASSATSVTVNPDPVPFAPVVAPSATIDLGQSVTLTGATQAGTGTPVVTFQWRSGTSSSCAADSNIQSATGTTYVASPSASTYYCYSVTDGSVNPPSELSSTVLITVNGLPAAGAITVGPAPYVPYVDLGAGETVTLFAHGSGGTGTLNYQWYNGSFASCASDTNPVGVNSPMFTTPSGLSASTDYCYKVTDSANPAKSTETATGFPVIVEPTLLAGAPSASPTVIDVGGQVTLTASVTGGYGPYSYQWFTGSANCHGLSMIAPATSSPATVSPAVAGVVHYCYRVTDSSNGTPLQESNYTVTPVSVTVYGTLGAGAVTCYDDTSHAACLTVVPNGDAVTLTAHPSAGNSASYHYLWYSGPSTVCASDTKVSGQTNATLNVTAALVPGAYYCYSVTDGTPAPSVSSTTYFLDPAAPAAPESATFDAALALAGVRSR